MRLNEEDAQLDPFIDLLLEELDMTADKLASVYMDHLELRDGNDYDPAADPGRPVIVSCADTCAHCHRPSPSPIGFQTMERKFFFFLPFVGCSPVGNWVGLGLDETLSRHASPT